MITIKLEATHLRENLYVVRPEGALGSCGSYPVPWNASYIRARSPKEAIQKVLNLHPNREGITLVG